MLRLLWVAPHPRECKLILILTLFVLAFSPVKFRRNGSASFNLQIFGPPQALFTVRIALASAGWPGSLLPKPYVDTTIEVEECR